MEAFYPWIVFIHVVGGFTFALAHGASAAVALRLRQERELERVRALLDLSQGATGLMYAAVLVLLVAGVAGGFVAGLWGRGWIWAAIVLLVLMLVFMYARALPYYAALRRMAGQAYFIRGPHPPEPVDIDRLNVLLGSSRPVELAGVGYLGLVAILWLMFFKPF
jgi:MFS family permease